MTDYFHDGEDEDDPEVLKADTGLFVIGQDRHGRPCFGCYFRALVESFDDDDLEAIDAGEGVPDDVADEARRHGAGFSVVTDGMAYIVADIAGDGAIEVAETICQRFMQQVLLHAAKTDGLLN